MRVIRLIDEPDWQSRLSPIEEIFFATSPSAKTLRPDERQPFKERWLGRYIAYDNVVTEERARNVRFYEKNEFRPLATAHWNGADVVFMGRLFRPH